MNIAIDVMGGDNAPYAVLDGAVNALRELGSDVRLTLFGDGPVLESWLNEHDADRSRLCVVPTTEVIGCDEQPTLAVKRKKDSSLVRSCMAVAEGEADCVLSAGSTGALLTASTLLIRRQKGVKRPALAVTLPTIDSAVLLIDSGANTDCKVEYLTQFAVMGSTYMERVLGVRNPRVGLLNNGAEPEKGNELTKAAHKALTSAPVNFVGNCEARDVLSGDFDVVVADGFDGNMVLKSTEGAVSLMMKLLKRELMSSVQTKLGAALSKPAFRTLKHKMDYSEYGGAPLIGVNGGVIKAHGSSDARAFRSALLQAEKLVRGSVVAMVGQAVAAMPAQEGET